MKQSIKRILPLALAALLIVVLSGCFRIEAPPATPNATKASVPPLSFEPLPHDTFYPMSSPLKVAFKAETTSGEIVSEGYFTRHKVTFVNYWAISCHWCVEEMPDLQKLYEKYGNDVGFLGVALEKTADIDAVKNVLNEKGVKYTNAFTTPELEAMTDTSAIPVTILVLRDGSIYGEPIVGAVGLEKYTVFIEDALANAK